MSDNNLLLRNCQLHDPGKAHHGTQKDIFIENGLIKSIRQGISDPAVKSFDVKGASVSVGWFDIGVQACDPGYEHREDLNTAARAAAAGGYTAFAPYPNTHPVIQSKSEVLYQKAEADRLPVSIYPIGAASADCAGKDITEMYDMAQSGAKAFSDGKYSIQDSGLMMRALLYVKGFGGLIINQPQNNSIAGNGQLNEGIVSTMMGTKGIPHIAEELMVQRDIYLAEYTGSRLHIANISSAGSVALIRKAKARGVQVTCSVPVLNLFYEDKVLEQFDTQFKLLPPLRGKADIEALHQGLEDGTIDVISTNHVPVEQELKQLEFSYAKFGAIGLQTCYALCQTHRPDWISSGLFVEKAAIRPREIMGVPVPEIKEGAKAELTIFQPEESWVLKKEAILSISKNTPLMGAKFTGKVLGIVQGAQLF